MYLRHLNGLKCASIMALRVLHRMNFWEGVELTPSTLGYRFVGLTRVHCLTRRKRPGPSTIGEG